MLLSRVYCVYWVSSGLHVQEAVNAKSSKNGGVSEARGNVKGNVSSSSSSSAAANIDRDKTPPRRFPAPTAGPTVSIPPREYQFRDNANTKNKNSDNYQNLQDPPTPSGKVNERIRNLRQKCMEALGREAFQDCYQFLKEFEEVSDCGWCPTGTIYRDSVVLPVE
jgi:hypothetical protein